MHRVLSGQNKAVVFKNKLSPAILNTPIDQFIAQHAMPASGNILKDIGRVCTAREKCTGWNHTTPVTGSAVSETGLCQRSSKQ